MMPATLAMSVLGIIGAASMAPSIPDIVRRSTRPGVAPRLSMPALTALASIQTILIVIGAAWLGAHLGPRIGLSSRIFDSSEAPAAVIWAIARLLLTGAAIGALGAGVAFALDKPLVAYLRSLPLSARLLYGGLTEEVIIRWGLMTVVVWAVTRGVGSTTAGSANIAVVAGIVVVNAAFAALHIPILKASATPSASRSAVVIFVVSLPWGWLFWRYGIEAAMAAHMAFHAVVEALSRRRGPSPS